MTAAAASDPAVDDGETPFFLAAHRGQEDAFFYLEYECRKTDENMLKNHSHSMLKNDSDNTVLHSAIFGQQYRLAIRILQSYPGLADERNNRGLTPLHVLALQHQSFESSTVNQLGLFDLIFYKCIIVREETWEDRENAEDIKEIDHNRNSPMYPRNYKTCFDIYDMLKRFFNILTPRRDSGASKCKISTRPRRDLNTEEIDMSIMEGGNGKYVRNKGEGFTEEGPSTTIFDAVYEIFRYISFVPLHFLLSERLLSIAKKKRAHKLAEQLLNDLLDKTRSCKVAVEEQSSPTPSTSKTMTDALTQGTNICVTCTCTTLKKEKEQEEPTEPCVLGETPILTAARLGIKEIVEAILKNFPKAIEDVDHKGKNAVLLAAQHRQSRVYRLLQEKTMVKESIFCQVDTEGNSALHLASLYNPKRPWFTPGPALQMKWEITWHQYVRNSVPSNSFADRNDKGKTAWEIFIESHIELKKEGQEWLTNISTAYSLISTLIATVAFATSSSIPGDYDNGKPALEPEFAFSVFSISSLIALCTSMSATVFFVAILVTRHEQEDFAVKVPSRLQFGLTFLFASIASILVSFSSGFYFSVRNKLENAAYPIFAAMCLPVTLFAVAQLPLYLGLTNVIFFNPKDKIQHYDHNIDTH